MSNRATILRYYYNTDNQKITVYFGQDNTFRRMVIFNYSFPLFEKITRRVPNPISKTIGNIIIAENPCIWSV